MLRYNGYPQGPGRARGNLSYIQFLGLVRKLWEDGHPTIPVFHANAKQFVDDFADAEGPKLWNTVVIHKLEVRKPHTVEPKPRIREDFVEIEGEHYRIESQRFLNIVTFTVVDRDDVFRADAVIEAFEDMILEYTPVFRELGASDFFYSRRTPDNEVKDHGENFITRTVAYEIVTEKTKLFKVAKLNEIILDLRIFLLDNQIEPEESDDSATPMTVNIFDQYESATPSE